jgi:hypothetical protein
VLCGETPRPREQWQRVNSLLSETSTDRQLCIFSRRKADGGHHGYSIYTSERSFGNTEQGSRRCVDDAALRAEKGADTRSPNAVAFTVLAARAGMIPVVRPNSVE